MTYLEIAHATKSFGSLRALDDVSLGAAKGCFLTLLGPSGCGKTTLLRSIAGLQGLDSGEIRIEGRTAGEGGSRAVMVFQDYALFPHMDVRRNISYGLVLRKENKSLIERKVEETLSYLGIAGLGDRLPSQLSGGQQQRVALARALIVEPEVLLLDEPLSNLDAKLRLGIRSELKRIQQDLGVTTVYVTHDQAEALALSDLVAVMERGKVVQVGTPRDIYFRPAGAFVADFVGTANLFDALVLEAGEREGRLSAWGRIWRVGGGLPESLAGHNALFCARPESLGLGDPGDPDSIPGVIEQKMFEGSHVRYWVDTGAFTFVVDEAASLSDYELKTPVSVGFRSAAPHVVSTRGSAGGRDE